ncbi:MAG: FeoB-associated Cys-rich membrane protein [Prevotella sp.]
MWIFIVAIVVIGTVAAGASILWDKSDNIEIGKDCTSCTGFDLSCEQNCMMEAATKPVEYFDDEELDRYKGRTSDSFTDDEAEEFREVMMTMHPEEVKAWNRSLILRDVAMPDQIKDDYIMLAGE